MFGELRVSSANELAPLTQRVGHWPENHRTFRQLDKELRSLYCP